MSALGLVCYFLWNKIPKIHFQSTHTKKKSTRSNEFYMLQSVLCFLQNTDLLIIVKMEERPNEPVLQHPGLSKITAKQPLVFCCRLLLLGSFHAAGKCHVLWNSHPQLHISVITASLQLSEVITINGAICNHLFPFSHHS